MDLRPYGKVYRDQRVVPHLSEATPRILVLTTEPLPVPGSATTGAGLRAWGLTEGLRHHGLEVTVATPLLPEQEAQPDLPAGYSHVRYFRRGQLGDLLHQVNPTVVVLQHWGLAAEVPELSVPLAIDLAGPHLLERLFWGSRQAEKDLEEKLAALRRADFATCSGYHQRHYFYPYLAMAGFDLRSIDFPVVPYGLPATDTQPMPLPDEPTFVYGGAFLAWQDPSAALDVLLEEMDTAGRGRLLFYGGSHPALDASGGRFSELAQRLSQHPRVEMRGWKPFDQLVQEYRTEGSVALDLMAWNPERELAVTTRTMVYLHCGLPVIYNDYAELSNLIREHDCGWVLSPDDPESLRQLLRRILTGLEPLEDKRAAALRAAVDHPHHRGIEPLANFCRAPQVREGKLEAALAVHLSQVEKTRLQEELSRLRHPSRGGLGSLLKRLVPAPGKILAPAVYLLCWPRAILLWLRLRKTTLKL